MLQGLFGNKNVERVLIFLLVNEKCYGAQLQTLLEVPLTPLQQALLRLEKEEILRSRYEGKTRVYTFNDSYPFRMELENLLKKAYTLLPPQEKRKYCFIPKPALCIDERDKRRELQTFWERLGRTRQLSFSAKTRHGDKPSIRVGKAEVRVEAPQPNVLVFHEKGFWLVDHFPDTGFSNVFRWTYDPHRILIALEHLRYGAGHPVFLFHLIPTASGRLESIDPHLCAEDTYMGNIAWSQNQIDFQWRIIGPKKNDELMYRYEPIRKVERSE